MHEGRKAFVSLLDGECLEISVIARLTVNDVLTLAAHHCRLAKRDAQYFGVAFVDDNDHYHWLQPDKELLDYEFSTSKAVIHLSHSVRFFVDSIFSLDDPATTEFFFLEAHQQLRKGHLDLSYADYVRIGGLLLQIYRGDLVEDDSLRNHLRLLIPFPRFLSHHDIDQNSFERQILAEYGALRGVQRGSAIISLMRIVEKCSKYGSRLYQVNEINGGGHCVLSISSRGIQVFENMDSVRPKEIFSWNFLDNLYYKDRTFSIEVRDPRQILGLNAFRTPLAENDDDLAQAVSDPTTQVSITRRCQSISTKVVSVVVHSFVCESSALCRSIWTTAIAQHQFFLDQKDKEKSGPTAVSGFDQHEFSDRLNRLISRTSIGSSIQSLSSLHSSSSLNTMPSAKVADGSCPNRPTLMNGLRQKTAEDRQRDIELYKILRGKKAELEELLRTRLSELRLICMKEGEITGEMPEEINTTLRPGEEMPKLKKRVGTSFSIPEEILKSDKADKISQLETDVELHRRIVAAAERLAKDKTMNKSVRKKRQKDLAAAAMKLRGLELGLNQMRLSASKPDVSSIGCSGSGRVSWNAFPQQNNGTILTKTVAKSCPTTPRGSVPDLCTDGDKSDEYEDVEQIQQRLPESSSRRSLHQRFSEVSTSSNGSVGLPPRANSRRSNTTRSITSDELDNPLINASLPVTDQPPIYENIGYRSMSYRSSYRQAHYPTLQDEQYLRKRALSAHSISHIDVPTSAGYTHRLDNITFQLNQGSKAHIPEDDDITPTIEHPEPLWRIPTSFSCQAGFSTASLDRRNTMQRPSPSSTTITSRRDLQPYSLSSSRNHSPAAHRVTTFPVCSSISGGFDRKPCSSSDLPRYQSSFNRPTPSSYNTSRGGPQLNRVLGSTSAGKLPSRPDPHMEALLEYYKGQSAQSSSPKTATIV
ncbi:hypothetical protein KIN20_000915 [Parelaphostrongylus tenuis]|uniref:FERM domain-containing protein n=1 Tax=Parelaphostrongylus tenuis TaxID=148309 RepID=A0AAD5ME08_PARTN|nr:hypothetical protein KIN20_000915 [Parelaphostrongylus tenuis]